MTFLRAICFGNPYKNTQIYSNFHNFFKLFQNFSDLVGKESPLGFDNRFARFNYTYCNCKFFGKCAFINCSQRKLIILVLVVFMRFFA